MGQQDLLILPHHHQQWQQPRGQATTRKRERRNNRWVRVTCYRDVCGVCVVSAGGQLPDNRVFHLATSLFYF